MPNNFRVTGDYYVSKVGDDLNAGTDPNLPKKTIGGAIAAASAGQSIVVGFGEYKEGFSSVGKSGLQFFSDGIVTVQSDGVTSIAVDTNTTFTADNTGNWIFRDFNGVTGLSFNNGVVMNGVVFQECDIGGALIITYDANDCAYVTCGQFGANPHRVEAVRCVVLNTTLGNASNFNKFDSCYFDATSVLITNAGLGQDALRFNDIEGIVQIGGTNYRLYLDANGDPVSPTPAEADVVAVYADIYTTRASFNNIANFNNLAKRDYLTVMASSMLLRRGNALTNIGGTVYGSHYNTGDTSFYPGVSTTNVTLSSGDIVTTSTSGQIVSGALAHADTVTNGRRLERWIIATILAYNSDLPRGDAENNNVLMAVDYVGTAGENPKRMTFEARWATSQEAPDPLVDSEWDNDTSVSGVPAGDWTIFEVGGLASIDTNSVGRGDENFDQNSAAGIRATWYQYRLTIFNGM